MIAQITNAATTGQLPDPHSFQTVGWAIFTLVVIIAGMRQVLGFWRELRNPPVTFQHAAEYTTKRECEERHSQSVAAVATLKQEFDSLRKERKEDQVRLDDKMQGVAEDVAGLNSSNNLQNQRLAEVNSKLDRLIEKVIGRL